VGVVVVNENLELAGNDVVEEQTVLRYKEGIFGYCVLDISLSLSPDMTAYAKVMERKLLEKDFKTKKEKVSLDKLEYFVSRLLDESGLNILSTPEKYVGFVSPRYDHYIELNYQEINKRLFFGDRAPTKKYWDFISELKELADVY